MKNCKNCGHAMCRYTGKDAPYCSEWRSKEYKITSEEVKQVIDYLNKILCGEAQTREITVMAQCMENYMKKHFPEEFKPKQEWCCDLFEIFAREHLEPRANSPDWKIRWYFKKPNKANWFMKYCLDCGQKPIPPIKS